MVIVRVRAGTDGVELARRRAEGKAPVPLIAVELRVHVAKEAVFL